jgi:hypothetical protein
MRKAVVRVGAVTLVSGLAIAAWLGFDAYRKTQQTPDFYQEALAIPPEKVQELHAEVEQSLEQLETVEPAEEATEAPPTWEWTVTDEQANAWLATEGPELLKQGRAPFSDPRVEFEEGVAKVAVRYEDSRFSSVLSGDLRVSLDGETGKVEALLTDVRSGRLALPLDWAKDRIEKAVARIKWPIQAQTAPDSISAESELPDGGFEVRDGRRLRPTEIVVEEDRLIVRGIVLSEEDPGQTMRVSTRVARGS